MEKQIDQKIREITALGPYLFLQHFADVETALAVLRELPYCRIDGNYVDCTPGTKASIQTMSKPGGKEYYTVVTGGNLTPEVAARVFAICQKHKPMDDSVVVKPSGSDAVPGAPPRHEQPRSALPLGPMRGRAALPSSACSNCGKVHTKPVRPGVTEVTVVCSCGSLVTIRAEGERESKSTSRDQPGYPSGHPAPRAPQQRKKWWQFWK